MKTLFKPATIIMGNLRFPVKFASIFILVFIPLVYLAYNMVSLQDNQVKFLKQEIKGVEYLHAVRMPLQHLQAHRGLTAAYLNGAKDFNDRIMSKRKDVDKFIASLIEIEDRLGPTLNLKGTSQTLSKQWEAIKANSMQQSTAEAIKSHSNLIKDVLALMVKVADNSGITLDPELDTYYMGAAIVTNLPNLIENMGQTRAVASAIAAKGEFNQKSYVKLAVLINNIGIFHEHLAPGLEAAFDSNPSLKIKLGSLVEANNRAIDGFEELITKELMEADTITISSSKVFDAATQAINTSYKLYDDLSPELTSIFNDRIKTDISWEILEIVVVLVVLFLLFYLFVGFYYSVMNNLNRVGIATTKMADGELNTRLILNGKDEMQKIAVDFNSMAEKFEALVQQIMSATSQLAAASEEVAVISQESASNLNQQRSETEQVATAMNEMSATVQEVARNAGDASGAANNADNEAKAGNSVVQQASRSIDELAHEVENAAKVIQQLAQDSDSIGSVLTVIKGIAEQTNLLALNAAIEAARAGEQGRGFAVVADEVRTLAGRTQESTQEIEAMIDKLQSGAKNAVTAMETGREKATIGVEQTKQAGEALAAITRAVATISEMNLQIASAAEEQSATTEEMNKNIININQLADQTASSADQSTAASAELAKLANDLQSLVSHFNVG